MTTDDKYHPDGWYEEVICHWVRMKRDGSPKLNKAGSIRAEVRVNVYDGNGKTWTTVTQLTLEES